MHPRLKNIVFHKLNKDLSKCEIILAENQSIWFIDRANKYWYFELEKCGKLWWRYEFFTEFFTFFSLEDTSFQRLLSQWVESILNREVVRINENHQGSALWMDYILSREVAAVEVGKAWTGVTEGVQKHGYRKGSRKVEDVLNREINEIEGGELFDNGELEKILNRSVDSTTYLEGEFLPMIENVLNLEVNSTGYGSHDKPNQINKVLKTTPDMNSQDLKVDIVLNQKS